MLKITSIRSQLHVYPLKVALPSLQMTRNDALT